MAWLMFKDSGTYQYRGKKCQGFSNQVKSRIDLSWGMDTLDQIQKQKIKLPNLAKNSSKPLNSKAVITHRQHEELQKIMSSYKEKKMPQNSNKIRVMDTGLNNYNQRSERKSDQRAGTEQSQQKIRLMENSLLPATSVIRKDVAGSIIYNDMSTQFGMAESRVSRRSTSGNKKNESNVILGDGIYNQFVPKKIKNKDYHQRLMEMYQYEEENKRRNISQIF